jgi:hypothetical protein
MGDACEQRVEIEDRAHLAADFRQRFERGGVLVLRLEQAGIDDGLRHVRPELTEHLDVALGKGALLVREQIEGAQDLSFVPQRHRQAGGDVLDHTHPARLGGDIADQDRTLFGDGRADHALADLETEVLDDVFGIADGVRDVEVAAAFVEQVDGEDREGREA